MKRWFMCVALALLTLCSCSPSPDIPPGGEDGAGAQSPSPSNIEDEGPSPTSYLPPELGWDDDVNNPNVDHMTGIWLQIPDVDFYTEDGEKYGAAHYPYEGGDLTVSLTVTNALKGVMKAGLIILCDGVPVPSVMEGESESRYTHFVDLEGQIYKTLRFTPEFSAGIGLISAALLYDTEKSTLIPAANGPIDMIYVDLPEGRPEPKAAAPVSLRPRRSALDNNFTLDKVEGDRMVSGIMGWIVPKWMADDVPLLGILADLSWPLKGFREFWFESSATLPGWYRATFFMDFEPYAVLDGSSTIDFYMGEGNDEMLILSVPLPEDMDKPMSFFCLFTEMDVNTGQGRNSFTTARYEFTP